METDLKKGVTIGDNPVGFGNILNADWSVSYGAYKAFEFLGASTKRNTITENKDFRQDTYLLQVVNNWIIFNACKAFPNNLLSLSIAEKVVYNLAKHIISRISDRLESADKSFHTNIMEKVHPKNILPTDLPIQLTPTFFERESKNDNRYMAGSMYWFDHERFGNSSMNPKKGKIKENVLREIIVHAYEDVASTIREKLVEKNIKDNNSVWQMSAISMMFNVETEQLIIGYVGQGDLLAVTNSGEIRLILNSFGEKVRINDRQSIFYENNRNEILKISNINTEQYKTLVLLDDSIKKDIVPNTSVSEKLSKTWAYNLDEVLRSKEYVEDKAKILMDWLASYNFIEMDTDRTMFILMRGNETNKIKKEKLKDDQKAVKSEFWEIPRSKKVTKKYI